MKKTKRHRPSAIGTIIGLTAVVVTSLAALWRVDHYNQQMRQLQAAAQHAERKAIAAEQARAKAVAKAQHLEGLLVSEKRHRSRIETELAEARKEKPEPLPAMASLPGDASDASDDVNDVPNDANDANDVPHQKPVSASVPLDFTTDTIRVIARDVPRDGVLVDVDSSWRVHDLKSLQPGEHRLTIGTQLPASMAVVVDVTIDKKPSAHVVELRPACVLPSGDRIALTMLAGSQRMKKLRQHLQEATAAESQLPAMRQELRRLRTEAAGLQHSLKQQGSPTTATGYTAQAAARQRAVERLLLVNNSIKIGAATVAAAEKYVAQKSKIQSDYDAMLRLSDWIKYVAEEPPAVKVRIHAGGATLVAVVR